MIPWNSQLYRINAPAQIPPEVTSNAIAVAQAILAKQPELPVILSLAHLSHYTGVNYRFLRNVVSRTEAGYTLFRIHKRPRLDGSRQWRLICAPRPELKQVQRWIVDNVLRKLPAHEASCAYSPDSSILRAATLHCGARWLIKMDVRRFFESVKEHSVYRIFRDLGYQPLVSFELARICTRTHDGDRRGEWSFQAPRYPVIQSYSHADEGHLPQGAPTSPMLANLAVRDLDCQLMTLSNDSGLVYSRYADDIVFSTRDSFDRTQARKLIYLVSNLLAANGFRPNLAKTQVVPPGARKIVLGLLCDGKSPKLTKEFRANIRQHLHYLLHEEVGPVSHAQRRGFDAVAGLRNHLWGLLSFAEQVDPIWAQKRKAEFSMIDWPLRFSQVAPRARTPSSK